MKPRTTRITLVPEKEPLFSEEGFDIEVMDEAGGEFVIIHCHMRGYDKIAINPEEWPALREAIDQMVAECRD